MVLVMQVKFSFNKYSLVFNRASLGYGELEKFRIKYQYVDFPEEGYNFSFTDAEFHIISSAPTL
jgi:hypothetical protein